MIGKLYIDLNELYEEQIRQHRQIEHKLRTQRTSVAAINYHSGLKKQLEDRDYIYVEKSLKMIIDDDLKQCVPNPKQPSTFEAMFKFCVLPNTSKHTRDNSMASTAVKVPQMQMRPSELMKKMSNFNHQHHVSQMSQFSQFSTISGISSAISQDSQMNLNHMPGMSNFQPNHNPNISYPNMQLPPRPHIPAHMQQSTGLDKYVSQLRNLKKNVPPSTQPVLQPMYANSKMTTGTLAAGHRPGLSVHGTSRSDSNPPLLQNYSEDDSYFLMQLENEEMIDYQPSQEFGINQ